MTWFRCGGSGIPAALKSQMNDVLNKKFGTSIDYPPEGWPDDVNLLGKLPEKTASGAIANFSDGADAVPISSWTIDVNPTLSGKSSVICRQTGVNLWNESWETGAISETTGANTVNNSKIRPTGLIAVTPSTSFYIVCPQLIQILFYRKDETYIGIGSGYGSSRVFTTDANTYYIRFNVANAYGNTYNNDISVNYPSTDTSYHAHTTQIVNTVSLGRTIYGGQADVVNGTGAETHERIDLSSLTFSRLTNAQGVNYFSASISDMANGVINVKSIECEKYNAIACINRSVVTATAFPNLSIAQSSGGKTINIRDDSFSDADTFMASLQVGDYLTYPIATPEDFTFTPITPTPETALGTNKFWADTGDSEVTYRADIDLALAQLSGTRGLMMASRPVAQMVGEESDPDQVNELVEDNETEQEDGNDAR